MGKFGKSRNRDEFDQKESEGDSRDAGNLVMLVQLVYTSNAEI